MRYQTKIIATFNCSLERAFKTPMLCDISKVHTGYGFSPRVTHCTEDENWGKVGGSKKVFMLKNNFFKGGEGATDTVIERIENKYWKIRVDQLRSFSMGIEAFEGEWATSENADGTVKVIYTYNVISKNILLSPLHWLFTKLFWRIYIKYVLENVRKLAYANEPYLYA